MKVAMVNTERTRGGAARMAATLAQSLNRTGQAQATLYHCEDTLADANCEGLRRHGSRQLNALLARLGGSLCVADLGVADTIVKRAHDADILHLHNLHGYYLDYRKLLRQWGERPIVWTWHDMWGATGRCGFSEHCAQWQSGCGRCPHMHVYPKALLDFSHREFQAKTEIFLRSANLHIVAPSHWLRDIAVKRGYDASSTRVIANPVDTDKFRNIERNDARSQLQWPVDRFTALFVAADCNDKRKGYTDFATSIKTTGIDAIAIGSPPAQPAENIKHFGSIADQSQLNLYYAAADLMVIPTYSDNYPNTVIEAMASGTPVLGYATGGVPSQIDNEFCQLVRTGDVAALTAALSAFAARGAKDKATSTALNAIAQERWHPQVVAEQYVGLYRSLLQRRASS